jgi:DNA-binding beta-propeller fold protein YncE
VHPGRHDGEIGHRDGEGTFPHFSSLSGIAVDEDGNIIVADTANHRIRKITPQGQVSTLAGTSILGYRHGERIVAQFNYPYGIAVDGGDNVVVAEMNNHRIRKIIPHGQVSTLAGTGEEGHRDGEGTVAQFNGTCGFAVDRGGNIGVADQENYCIRKITPSAKCLLWWTPARRVDETGID